jgi:meso-butanediol dehydrogenase / (S,S)-butanediol dehydrogenase / diacetyl reductase
MYDLTGKVALVTGAGRGIGQAIAVRLAQEGANVVVTDIDGERAEAVAAQIRALGANAISCRVDVTQADQIQTMTDQAIAQFKQIDILVNNAGINLIKPMLQMTEAEWDRLFDVNLKSYWLCARAIAPQMVARGQGGKIINAASKAGKTPSRYAPIGAYSTSKHGVIGFTRSLAMELAPSRINVNCFCPGIVDTDMWEQIDREVAAMVGRAPGSLREQALADIPLGRVDTPAGVAKLVAFLASAESDYMTGQSVNLTGGLEMH